jgi:uncharacterized integral membrane protein
MLYLILIVFLIVGGALTVITVQNFTMQHAHVALFIWQTPELPVGLLVLISFLLGALVLYLVSALSALRDSSELRRTQRRVAELEQQLASVTAPQAMPQAVQNIAMPTTEKFVPPQS